MLTAPILDFYKPLLVARDGAILPAPAAIT